MLKFFGRGAGFADEHNGAYFTIGSKMILMDCPLITFFRLKKEGIAHFNITSSDQVDIIPKTIVEQIEINKSQKAVSELIIAITHTHSDHIGGLGLTIHYATFIWGIPVTVIAPSEEVRDNLGYMLEKLEGCAKSAYRLVTAEEYIAENRDGWLKAAIPTTHVPNLEGKCFGYNLKVEGKNVVYTGDTCTLEPFLPYIIEETVLYTECSAYNTDVHIFVEKLLDYSDFFRDNSVEVFLMHLDDIDAIKERIAETDFELAPLA